MDYIITTFLCYHDVIILRQCCVYLHNFTRQLRLRWKIFPKERQPYYGYIIYSFLQWAKLPVVELRKRELTGSGSASSVGSQKASDTFILKDRMKRPICRRYLECECIGFVCGNSHDPIEFDRKEMKALGLVVEYEQFMALASRLFGPKYLWKYSAHISKLFFAFGKDKDLELRKVL
jgi:hypothetical protein